VGYREKMTAEHAGMKTAFFYDLYRSDFGAGAICWRSAEKAVNIVRVVLPVKKDAAVKLLQAEFPEVRRGSYRLITQTEKKLAALIKGKAVSFDLRLLDWDICSPFQKRVLQTEALIPRGSISTYGRIAAHLSMPRAARAVGHALALNPFPLIIPCHRAVRSDGGLGGFQGGLAMKRRLLELEGIAFSPSGKAQLNNCWF
jgi:methylated-DNA-[protein]-cysteine S-methyltransferase